MTMIDDRERGRGAGGGVGGGGEMTEREILRLRD